MSIKDRREAEESARSYAQGRQDEAGDTSDDRNDRVDAFATAFADGWDLYHRHEQSPNMVTLKEAYGNWLCDRTIRDPQECARCGFMLVGDFRAEQDPAMLAADPGARRCRRCVQLATDVADEIVLVRSRVTELTAAWEAEVRTDLGVAEVDIGLGVDVLDVGTRLCALLNTLATYHDVPRPRRPIVADAVHRLQDAIGNYARLNEHSTPAAASILELLPHGVDAAAQALPPAPKPRITLAGYGGFPTGTRRR